jgi:MFS family permease
MRSATCSPRRHGSARLSSAGSRWRLTIWSTRRDGRGPLSRAFRSCGRHLLLEPVGLTYSASVAGFIVVRFVLGLGESGNFPAAIKTVAEWFPQRERAFATGLFNAGTNIGAVITPMTVPFITARFGWTWAFVLTGVLGFAWLVAWLRSTRRPDRHPRLKAPERAFITSDPVPPATHMPWLSLMGYRQTWSFASAKFLTDPIWWMYLFWLPDFFSRNYGLSLLELGRRSSSSTSWPTSAASAAAGCRHD